MADAGDAFDPFAAVGSVPAPIDAGAAPAAAVAPAAPVPPSTFQSPGADGQQYTYRIIPGSSGVYPDDEAAFLAQQPTAWQKAGLPPPPIPVGTEALPAGTPQGTATGTPNAAPAPASSAAPAPGAPGGKPFDPFAALGAVPVSSTAPTTPAGGLPAGPAPLKPGQRTGLIANAAGGFNEGVAETLGGLPDAVAGAVNLGSRGINAVAGTAIPPIQNPIGGTDWWKSAMGVLGADPRNVVAQTQMEKNVRAAGQGVAAAVLPLGPARVIGGMEAAPDIVRAVAAEMGNAGLAATSSQGAASGYTGQAASDAAPAPLKPLANFAGQVLGGGAAAGAGAATLAAANTVRNVGEHLLDPIGLGTKQAVTAPDGTVLLDQNGSPLMLTAAQQQIAAKNIANATGQTPGQLAARVPDAGGSVVPGSQPTLGQVTGDMRVLGLERQLRTRNPQMFNSAEAQRNGARVSARDALAHPDAQAEATSGWVNRALDQIDQDADTQRKGLQATADGRVAGLGGSGTAADQGSAMAGQVRAHQDPILERMQSKVDRVAQKVDQAAGAFGPGKKSIQGGATAEQQYGAETRTKLQEVDDAAAARTRKLFKAFNPDGKLAMAMPATKTVAAELRAELIPGGATKFSPDEEAAIRAFENMPDVVPVAFVEQERRTLNAAILKARNAGESNTVRILSRLKKDGIDADFSAAVAEQVKDEAPFVKSGQIGPDQSTMGRLAAEAAGGAPVTGHTVFTPSGRSIDVRYGVEDAANLTASHTADMKPNPAFPKELQPRDRTRAASEAQVSRIAGQLQPERLGASASAGEGAPIVGPDGVVESGNARLLGLRRAYAAGGDQAKAYRAWLEAQGMDTTGMKEPVLVRHRITPLAGEDRVRWTEEANASAGLSMSAGERAAVDARRISDDMLASYQGGDVTSAANRDFVRAFVRDVTDRGEEGSFMTREGELSSDGATRLRNALLQRAYDSPELVSALAETGDENIKAFGGALMDAAGPIAKLEASIRAGHVDPNVSVSKHLVEAARLLADARRRGISLADSLAQRDAFEPRDAVAEKLLQAAYGPDLRGRMSRGRMGEVLSTYADLAAEQSTGARLFGDNLDFRDLLQQAEQRYGTGPSRQSGTAERQSAGSARPGDGESGAQAGGSAAGPAGPAGAAAGQGGRAGGKTRALDHIRSVISQDPSAKWGIRVVEDAGDLKPGDKIPASRVWDNGDPTDQLLNGSSTIGINGTSEKAINDALKQAGIGQPGAWNYYYGKDVLLVKGSDWHSGEDAGERIIEDPVVAGRYSKTDSGPSHLLDVSGAPGGSPKGNLAQEVTAPPPALQPNVTPEAAAQYRAGLASHQARKEQTQGVPDQILAQRNFQHVVADSGVMSKIFPGGDKEAEGVQSLVRMLGPDDAEKLATDYLGFDLRQDSKGNLTAAGLAKWASKHEAALDQFPGVREKFGTLKAAQQALDDLKAARDTLQKAYPLADGATGAEVRAQYLKPGPKGTEAIQQYVKDSGGSPGAMQALDDAITGSMREKVMPGGVWDAKAYQAWLKQYGPALAERPQLAAQLADASAAQDALADLDARTLTAKTDLRNSAARFFIGTDPHTAVTRLMAAADPGTEAASLMKMMASDPDAVEGLRKAVADWITAKTNSTSEAGTTGIKQVQAATLKKLIANPKMQPALEAILGPGGMTRLRGIAADLDLEGRSVNATKMPGSPGTAMDALKQAMHSGGSLRSILFSVGASEMGAQAVSMAMGGEGVVSGGLRAAALLGGTAYGIMRQQGLKSIDDLMAHAVLNPELYRALAAKVTETNAPDIARRFRAALANLAASGALRIANGGPSQ